jgi:hypothetical protein
MTIIAVVLGMALFRQFDFETFRFEKPALSIVYLVACIGSLFLLIRDRKKTEQSDE